MRRSWPSCGGKLSTVSRGKASMSHSLRARLAAQAQETIAPIPVPAGSLLRILGLAFGIAVSVGSSIGSGILRFPGDVAAHLPSPGLFLGVWIAGGLYALVSAPSM